VGFDALILTEDLALTARAGMHENSFGKDLAREFRHTFVSSQAPLSIIVFL